MTDTTIQVETIYKLDGITFEDLEIICLGLDLVHDPEMCDRAKELTVIIEDIMPPVGSVDSE